MKKNITQKSKPRYKENLNQQSTLITAHMWKFMRITVHKCRTQYSTEQFWRSFLLSSGQWHRQHLVREGTKLHENDVS